MGSALGKDGKIPRSYYKSQMKKFDYEEIKMLQKIYKELANRSNGDGIDKGTFLQYFTLPGLWGERLFRKFDIKGTGHVDFDDFLLSISICCRGTKADKIAVLYQVFDLNEDGVIQKSEMVAMLSNLPNLEKYVKDQPKLTHLTSSDFFDSNFVSNEVTIDHNVQNIPHKFSYLNNIPSDSESSCTSTSESDDDLVYQDYTNIYPLLSTDSNQPSNIHYNESNTYRGTTHSKIYDSLMALHFKNADYEHSNAQASGRNDSSISGMSRSMQNPPLDESTTMDMDDLIEKLLEGSEFSENDTLSLLEFKAWIEKNEYLIHMFSECLHEEVWGLQGNAFHLSNRMNPGFKPPSPRVDHESHEPSVTDASLRQMTYQDYQKIKSLFTIDTKHRYGIKAIDRTTKVVSEEIVQHMKEAMNKEVDIQTNKENPPQNNNEVDSDQRDADILLCPSCKTPYLLCFKCHSRYRSLHLVIFPNQIFIECETCLLSCDPPYSKCWICSWPFDNALKVIAKSPTISKEVGSVSSDSPQSQKSHATPESLCMGSMQSILSTVENALDIGAITTTNLVSPGGSSHIPASISSPKSPIMSGVLYKIGKHLHQWKERYYVLVDNILYYYSDKYSPKPRGCIFLEGCYLDNVSERNETPYEGKYGFSICHKGKKYSRRDLYANSQETMQMWVDSLTLAMKQQSLTETYQMCEQLGHGKFSVVYRCIHKQTDAEYAIKIIDKRLVTSQERELLRCEMAILRLLRHRNVIYLKDIIDSKDSLYIIMELVRGGELYNFLYSEQCLTEMHSHKIIVQLLETVSYLHKCGIVHRDIKPENILLTDTTPEATIKLTDFGLSTLCGPNEKLTQPCGTLAYVAPEVLTLEGYNHKVDSWSIGVVMYLLMRGRLPFSINHKNSAKPENLIVSFDGPIWAQISSSAKDLITKLLQPNPENRISVTEALDHIWVKNPTAVIQETPFPKTNEDPNETATELLKSLKDSKESTFIMVDVANAIKNVSKDPGLSNLRSEQSSKEKLSMTLDTVKEVEGESEFVSANTNVKGGSEDTSNANLVSSAISINYMDELPDDVLYTILKYTYPEGFLVCRRFGNILQKCREILDLSSLNRLPLLKSSVEKTILCSTRIRCLLVNGWNEWSNAHISKLATSRYFKLINYLSLRDCYKITSNALLPLIEKLSSNLIGLDLYNCYKLDSTSLISIARLPNLEILSLGSCTKCQYTNESLKKLFPENLKNNYEINEIKLKRLYIIGCKSVTDVSFLSYHYLNNLEYLDLTGLGSNESISCLSSLTNLKYLIIPGLEIPSDILFCILKNMRRLECLDISGSILDDRIAHVLSQATEIKSLKLSKAKGMDNSFLRKILASLPLLTQLDVSSCWKLTESFIANIKVKSGSLFTEFGIFQCSLDLGNMKNLLSRAGAEHVKLYSHNEISITRPIDFKNEYKNNYKEAVKRNRAF